LLRTIGAATVRSKLHTLRARAAASSATPYDSAAADLIAAIITHAAGDNGLSVRVMMPNASIRHGKSIGSTATMPCPA
jgi:hypothetical protein